LIKQILNNLAMVGLVVCACAHSTLADSSTQTSTTTTGTTTAAPTSTVATAPAPAASNKPPQKSRSLAYLSCPFISTAEASDTPAEISNTGANTNLAASKKTFSPAQEAMMQNLSRMINVSNGGVWLALKLDLSIR
jgi:hypothetical protein